MLEIVIPTYNRPKLLLRTLENLNAATIGSDATVIIADNSTNEETAIMVAKVINNSTIPLKYHRYDLHEPNVGKSILRSISLGTAKYVWILGDDDLISPGAVSYVISVLKSNPNTGLLYLNYLTGKFRDNRIDGIHAVRDIFEEESSLGRNVLEFLPEVSFISSCIFDRHEFLKQNIDDFSNCYGYEFLGPLLLCSMDKEFINIQYPIVLQRRLLERHWDEFYPLYYFVGLPNVRRLTAQRLNLETGSHDLFSFRSIKPLLILSAYKKSREVCFNHFKSELNRGRYYKIVIITKLIPSFISKYILRNA